MKIFDSSSIIAILGDIKNPELLVALNSPDSAVSITLRVVQEIKRNPAKESLKKMLDSHKIKPLIM